MGGGVFVSSPAYADGYVDGTGNNIYYGFKTDASYAEAHFNIDVEYYDTLDHAKAGGTEGIDPLGKFVRVHYLSNCNNDATADEWKFRPMWWFGVPAGLKDPQYIHFKRIEKLTKDGKQQVQPAGSSQKITTDANGYGAVSDRHYNSTKEWSNLSNFYFSGNNIATKGWKQLVGLGDKDNSKTYDNAGDTEKQWNIYKQDTQGLKGIFVDWESAGRRWYDMTYVSEMEETTWKNRDQHPLRFAAGVYRFAGNWHYAAGQKHNTPKIADYLKLAYPEVTKVKNPNALTPTEQDAIKDKIKAANKDTKHYSELVDKVEVSDKGVATITFKDNTKRTIPASLLVTKDETDKDKYRPTLPTRTPVVNLKKLTPDEKTKIRQAIIDANGGSTPNEFLKHVKQTNNQYEFKVNDNGSVEVTYEDDSKLTIPAEDLVYQGATIADWAPYVVPAPIEVKDPSKLDADEQKKVTDAFDTANADLDVYTAAKKNGATPVSFDKDFKNAIITWADGSTTEIPSWQFLKKKAAGQTPTPKPPTPKPAEEKKTFTVDLPADPTQVAFDPFDKNANVATDSITSLQKQLMKRTAKDANDPSKSVTITSATISIADGTVTFKAEGYEDKVYPIGIFYKKRVNGAGTQNPAQQTPTSKTNTDPDQAKNTFTYNVRKMNIAGDKATPQEAAAALKQFVKDNYDNVDDSDFQNHTDSIPVLAKWKPKSNTKNMGSYDATGTNAGPMKTIELDNSYGIKVIGHPWLEGDEPDWDSAMTIDLITIPASDLYVPNSGSQTPTDNTIENLRKLAKQIRDQRKTAGELADADITTLKAADKDIDGMTDEKALRDLIKKISDYQKPKPVEYKYNFEKLTLDHDGDLTDDDYKKIVVEQFLKKNYTTTDNTNWSKLEGAYNNNNKTIVLSGNNANTYNLTPVASGTSGLNIYTGDKQTGSVTSVIVDSKTGDLVVRGWKAGSSSTNAEELIRIKKADLFTPKPKDQNPTITPEQLQQMKDDAKKIIDKNPYLTPDQKKQFKDKIDDPKNGPKDQKGIQNILNEAKEQGEKNKQNTSDPNVQQIINNNKGGGDEKKQHELDAAKEAAKKAIDALTRLSEQEKTEFKNKLNGTDVKTPADVQKIVDAAKLADELKGAKDGAQKEKFVFLDHGTGADGNTAETHAEDAALNELLGTKPAEDSTLKTLADKLKEGSKATAEEIKNALDAAKRQNAINEENAKNAGIAKLEAKKAELDAAYNALNDEQKANAKAKYEAAVNEINTAKGKVNSATKPSDIKNAVDGVKTSFEDANKAIEDAKGKRNTTQNTYDDQSELNKEKEDQKKRIQDSNLSKDDKQKAIDDIEAATKVGDPTAIANRALKAKKIEDAKKQIAALDHLNKAQKKYYEDLLDSTDASDHVDEAGKSTGKDDIDDALEQALNLNGVMKRLADLATSADTLKKDDKDKKYSSADKAKKDAFDAALNAANTQLDKVKDTDSDNINADGANALYNDLLKAMQGLDSSVKGVDLYTDDLQKEYNADLALKDKPVYKNATKNVKEAFDKAFEAAKTALENATKNPTALGADAAAQQNAIGAALANLVNAAKALDGIDTTALQAEVNKDKPLTDKPVYKNATKNVKEAFDKALAAAEDAINDAEGKKQLAAGEDPKTQEQKQKAVNDALTALQNAAKALDGKEQEPTPTPSVDKSGLKDLVDAAEQVKDSDAYKYADADKQGAYDKAISDGQNVLAKTDATADDVANAVQAITTAKTALDGKKTEPTPTPSVDKSHLQQGINGSGDVKKSDDYTNAPSDKKQSYDHALDHANEVNNNPNATQDQVNQATEDLKKAQHDLKPTPNPLPTPGAGTDNTGTDVGTGNTGSGSEAGYGVNDNAPTTVDKGELNIQIDSAEADSKPGNAGDGAGNAGNAGAANANAGSAPNAQGGAGAQGAGAGTGNTGAANAGVDNKAVNNAVENSPEVKQADAAVKQAAATLDEALTQAKRVAADPHATQAQVDAAAVKLADARKAFADAQANAAKVRAAVRSRVIKGMRSRGNAGIATGANVATAGLMATMIAAIGGAFVTRRMRTKHANRD